MRDVVERPQRPGEVERSVLEREILRVALDERDVVEGTARARVFEQLGDAVDADDLAHERRERERERAGSGADVECALVAAREHERAHDVGELAGARVLPCRDPVGGACEPVRRRRRHGGRATDWS